MEKIKMTRDSKKYKFKKGDEFVVKRNINNECVIVFMKDRTPNAVISERQARRYGKLSGTPQLCFS